MSDNEEIFSDGEKDDVTQKAAQNAAEMIDLVDDHEVLNTIHNVTKSVMELVAVYQERGLNPNYIVGSITGMVSGMVVDMLYEETE